MLQQVDTSKGKYAPLPNSSTLDKAFGMEDWNKDKNASGEYLHMEDIVKRLGGYMIPIPGSNVQIPSVAIEASVEALNFEEILEVSGCHVSSCNTFNAVCEEGGIYEFWTEEYVSGLADYLMDQCTEFNGETIIVDVGAGDGTLVHFLDKCMKERGGSRKSNAITLKQGKKSNTKKSSRTSPTPVPKLVATDDGSWNIQQKANVEKLSVTEALQKYNPFDAATGKRNHQLIVICSWMPMGVDWTQLIRDHGADEYILIGECDDGNCGHNWLTFGNPEFKDDIYLEEDESKEMLVPSVVAPCKVDGFERTDLEDLSLLQYSRFDSSVSGSSKTISFRRK